MDEINWLTDVLPLEVLHHIIPYCAIELYTVDTFIRNYITESHLLFQDARVKNVKIPVARCFNGSKHHVLQNHGIELDDDIKKVSLLEWAVLTQSMHLLKMILSIPQTNLCVKKLRSVRLALEHDRVESLRAMSVHPTFNNAMTLSKVAIDRALRLCGYNAFVAVFEHSNVKPTSDHWKELMQQSHMLDTQRLKMRYLLTVNERYAAPFVLDVSYKQISRLGPELMDELLSSKHFCVSFKQNAFFEAATTHFNHTTLPNPGAYPKFVKDIINHCNFTWNQTSPERIAMILSIVRRISALACDSVMETIDPAQISIVELLMAATYHSSILDVIAKRFPEQVNFVAHDDLDQIFQQRRMKYDWSVMYTALKFWISHGYMASIDILSSVARQYPIEGLIAHQSFPAKQMLFLMKTWNLADRQVRHNLKHVLMHPSMSLTEDILPIVENLIMSGSNRYDLTLLASLVDSEVFDPTWNNYYYIKMVWQTNVEFGYEKFIIMSKSKSMKRAFMTKDVIYDEIRQTINFRVHPKSSKS